MKSFKTRPSAKLGQPFGSGDNIPAALLKQARQSGQLNLSGRGLKTVPASVWHINSDTTSDGASSFDNDDRWWDQNDLMKLILASNELSELSEDIALLPALNVLDVNNNSCYTVHGKTFVVFVIFTQP